MIFSREEQTSVSFLRYFLETKEKLNTLAYCFQVMAEVVTVLEN